MFSVLVCLYILFYITLVTKESKTIVVATITLDTYSKLYTEYGHNLSCPCITTTIALGNFLSNIVTMHPVCQSDFVSNQWIEGLYFANASTFINWDFRKTAYSQVSYDCTPIKLYIYYLLWFLYLRKKENFCKKQRCRVFYLFSLNFYHNFVHFRQKSLIKLKKTSIIFSLSRLNFFLSLNFN